MRKPIAASALLALALAGCTTLEGPKHGYGTLAGAALGGWLGSEIGSGTGRLAATGAGTLAGALTGGEIGASLDRADRLWYGHAPHRAPLGPPTAFVVPRARLYVEPPPVLHYGPSGYHAWWLSRRAARCRVAC